MKTDVLKKKFLENVYQDFDTINAELNILYKDIHKSIKNNYRNLLYANGKLEFLKKLKPEELFLMNMHDKHILAILNISIYEALSNENYETLYNGIYTYTHLRHLNRLHLDGFKFNSFIEHLIVNENIFEHKNDWKIYAIKQFEENFGEQMTGKFDRELMNLLKKIMTNENDVENHFNELLKLHSKTQWLTRGAYRECNLINYMPIYLLGIYKLLDKSIKIETNNKYLIDFIEYINNHKNIKSKLVYKFTGEIDFLNKILDEGYNEFCKEYKRKIKLCWE